MINTRHVICKTGIGMRNMSIHLHDKKCYVTIGRKFYYITYDQIKDLIVLTPSPIISRTNDKNSPVVEITIHEWFRVSENLNIRVPINYES